MKSIQVIWAILLICLLPLELSSQTKEDPFVRCTRCQNVGMRICRDHKKGICELETNVRYCSLVEACEVCGGTGWLDCKDCKNRPVERRLAKKRAELPDLKAGLARYSEVMERPLAMAQSDHFTVLVEIEVTKVGKKKVRKHPLLHLYVDRMEKLYVDYASSLKLTKEDHSKDSTLLIWSKMDEHLKASTRFTGQQAQGGVKLMGADPIYSVAAVPSLFSSDEELHRNVVHNVTHLLLSSQPPVAWFGNRKGGWADEGLAHWFEEHYFQICDNYCFQESDTNDEFKGGKWKPGVRKDLSRDSQRLLPALFEQNTDTLSLYQHALAFSLVDYLMGIDGKQVNELFRFMRNKGSTRDGIKKIYGLSVLKLESNWRTWVKETYPSR